MARVTEGSGRDNSLGLDVSLLGTRLLSAFLGYILGPCLGSCLEPQYSEATQVSIVMCGSCPALCSKGAMDPVCVKENW